MLRDLIPHRGRSPVARRNPESVFDMMEDFWRKPFSSLSMFGGEEFPAMDVREDDNEIKVTAELPGMTAEDIDISISGGRLLIKGEKKFEDEEKKDNYHRIERSYGSFQRSVSLPTNVDEENVKASYRDGVLTLTMPKNEKDQTRKIAIEH